MVLERSTLDLWRKSFLQDIQADAQAIFNLHKFLSAGTQSLNFDSMDYETHISKIINADPTHTAEWYSGPITTPTSTTPPPNLEPINYFNNFRTYIFVQEFIAPILLFPGTYGTERENFNDTNLIAHIYRNEQSPEIMKLLDLLTNAIGSYGSLTSDEFETEDMKTVDSLLKKQWVPSTWVIGTSDFPHLENELFTCVNEIQKILLIDGLFFNESMASSLLSYWYHCFYSKATTTEVFDYLETEIPRFVQYFRSAKPSPGASELFNLAVLYVEKFAIKANSRGNLQLISEKAIPATRKMMRRLNFATADEKNLNPKTLSSPHEYLLVYLLTKGDSKLADIYDKGLPGLIFDTVPETGTVGKTEKPTASGVDIKNVFPGEFLAGRTLNSFSNAYKTHRKLLDRYDQYLKNVFILKCKIPEKNRMYEFCPSEPTGGIEPSGGVIL